MIASLAAGENQPNLVREYKKDDAALIELSKDGKLILTRGARTTACQGKKGRCRVDVLTVYEALTGKQLAEYASKPDAIFSAPGFVEGQNVSAVEVSYDSLEKRSIRTGLHWNLLSGVRTDFLGVENFMPVCPLDNSRFLAVITTESGSLSSVLAIADASGLHKLNQPELALNPYDVGAGNTYDQFFVMSGNCTAWRSGSRYLVQSAGADRAFYWVSTNVSDAPQFCLAFPGERVHGYTVSPDGALLAVITGAGGLPVGAPSYHVFLNVFDARDCRALRRVELSFPEKSTWITPLLNPKARYRNNVAFFNQFARRLAVSPDDKMLAIAYGIFKDPDGLAFFGLYSLSDGHRLSTVPGDKYRCGIHGAIFFDELHCQAAPIKGTVQFSPDSRMLFATSRYLHQLNVSVVK